MRLGFAANEGLPPRPSLPAYRCESGGLLVVRGDQRGVRQDMAVHGLQDVRACCCAGYIKLLVEGKKLKSVMV